MERLKLLSILAAIVVLATSRSASAQITAETSISVTIRKKSVVEYASMAKGDYTGLIIDCRGLGLKSVMSPIIKNINGTKIYGHKDLDVDRIIREGMADYVSNPQKVSRAGFNPLIIRALSLGDDNSTPVISIEDSNRLLIENHATRFLKELKVVFLFD